MRKLSLIALFISFCVASTTAEPAAEADAQLAARVKAAISKIGTGPSARIDLKLRDGSKLKGYVSKVSDETFVVVNDKSGVLTEVSYPQVRQVKGNNLSTGVKVAIGIGIVIGVLLFVGWLGRGA